MKRVRKSGMVGFQMLCAIAGCASMTESADAKGGGKESSLVVRTGSGWLRGTRSGGVDRFLGIPYAAPPVGPLRWKPPQPPRPWSGVRKADQLPPRCAQIGAGGEEDCLYLNIYRPSCAARSGRLPVLFYIHGGGLKVGSAIDNDPSRIAERTGTIVVMINYRLGQFGFLAHPALGAEAGDGTSGEYGLMDQQAALRWVHEEIAAFGGDPYDVTIAGASAGGWSVCAHLASPDVADLFSGAVLQSADCTGQSLQSAEETGLAFATAVGCPDTTDATCLREKTTEEILAVDSWDFPHRPVWGGRLLAEDPWQAVQAGRFASVPVMMGGTRNEYRQALTGLYPMSEETYVDLIQQIFGDDAEAVLDEYPSTAYPEPFDAFAEVVADSGIGGPSTCSMYWQMATFAARVPTYVYEFDDPNAPPPSWVVVPPGMQLGSSHGSDEPYWFDRPFDPEAPKTRAQWKLADQMIQYLGAFAEHGAPRARHQPRWPRFDGKHGRMLRFRPGETGVRTGYLDEHHCDFWQSLGGG